MTIADMCILEEMDNSTAEINQRHARELSNMENQINKDTENTRYNYYLLTRPKNAMYKIYYFCLYFSLIFIAMGVAAYVLSLLKTYLICE